MATSGSGTERASTHPKPACHRIAAEPMRPRVPPQTRGCSILAMNTKSSSSLGASRHAIAFETSPHGSSR